MDTLPPSQATASTPAGDTAGGSDAIDVGSAPARIGRFRLLRWVGQGAMGVIHSAYDERLDRRVAIKLVREDRPELRARSLLEAQALAKLNHPNVVAIYEVGESHEQLFFAMEYVKGKTLRVWQQGRPWREIVAAYRQAAVGLAAAHAAGIVHRDFKPDNAIMGNDARVRVLDFGLASNDRPLDLETTAGVDRTRDPTDGGSGTDDRDVMGPVTYLAPEQLAGDPVDPRADQFAWCVAAYEALWGHLPFAGDTPERLRANILSGTFDARAPRTKAPTWLFAVLSRGLAADRNERWPSMSALLEALDRDPARRRRPILVLGAVTLGLGGIWAGDAWATTIAQRECDEAAARIDTVWNADARARLASVDTGGVDPAQIDAWARRWARLRTDACPAADIVAPQLQAHAIACLERHRDGLAAVIAAGPGPIEALTDLEPCLDEARLRGGPEPPAALAAEVTAVRARLAIFDAVHAAYPLRDGVTQASTIVRDAAALGWAPLEAEAELAGGRALARGGDTAAAAVRLEQSVERALGAGHDACAAEAAVALLELFGTHRPDQASAWARVTGMLLARAGIPEHDRLRTAFNRAAATAAQPAGVEP